MNNKKTGEFIASLRKEKGLTQKELAEKLFVTDRAVSKWERGIGYPDITIITELANILEVDTNEILYGEKQVRIAVNNSLKDSVKFYQKLQKKSILYKCCLFIPLGMLCLWLSLMVFTEVNKGFLPFSDKMFEMDDWPSFSKYSNQAIAKKFFKAVKEYDYDMIEQLLYPNDAKSHYKYIEQLKNLEKKGVKFQEIKKTSGHWNDYYGYGGYYDLKIEYHDKTGILNITIIKINNKVSFGGIIYNYNGSQQLIYDSIWQEIIDTFSINYD